MQPIDVVAEQMVRWYGKDSVLAHLENAQHFDITNVAKYAAEFDEPRPLREVSFAVPPWGFVYAETTENNGIHSIYIVKSIEHPKDDARSWTLDIHLMIVQSGRVGLPYRGKIVMTRDGRVSEQTDWENCLFEKWVRALGAADAIKDEWRQMWIKSEEQRQRIATVKDRDLKKWEELNRRWDAYMSTLKSPEEEAEYFTGDVGLDFGKRLPDRMMMIFFLATMLANCKNVVTSSEPVPPKLVRARKRKDRIAVERWYTLRIEPMQKKIRYVGIEGSDLPNADDKLTYERAWHICRGHFKEFKPERPLFGRVTGRFWWPSMVRGSKDRGIIHKDYELGDAAKSTTEGEASQRGTMASDESARPPQGQANEVDSSDVELATETR